MDGFAIIGPGRLMHEFAVRANAAERAAKLVELRSRADDLERTIDGLLDGNGGGQPDTDEDVLRRFWARMDARRSAVPTTEYASASEIQFGGGPLYVRDAKGRPTDKIETMTTEDGDVLDVHERLCPIVSVR